jgi:thiol:disulfide interchange protein DsbD
MAWGMGVPLLLMGVSAGRLMPRAGAWMEGVKQFFGLLLLATAWWMVTPLLPTWIQILGWAVLAMFAAVLLRPFEPLTSESGLSAACRKTLGLLLIVLSTVWILGIASGGRSLLQPLNHLSLISNSSTTSAGSAVISATAQGAGTSISNVTGKQQLLGSAGSSSSNVNTQAAGAKQAAQPSFQLVRTVAELETLLAQSNRTVMLDFYADWCVSCKEMEAFTFVDPRVVQRMNQMLLLKVDVTENNADDRALMKKFRLFGPPGIIFFKPGGAERKDVRVVGFQDATRFTATLDRALK